MTVRFEVVLLRVDVSFAGAEQLVWKTSMQVIDPPPRGSCHVRSRVVSTLADSPLVLQDVPTLADQSVLSLVREQARIVCESAHAQHPSDLHSSPRIFFVLQSVRSQRDLLGKSS